MPVFVAARASSPAGVRRQRWARRWLATASLGVAFAGDAATDLAAFFAKSDDTNVAIIDHAPWQALLDAYLRARHPSGVNRFDYQALKTHGGDTTRLRNYLTGLQAVDPRSLSRAEQKAYWINFYNALTVQLVAAAYPIESIRDIGDQWLSPGPWRDVHAEVAGQALTLDNMEHDILRAIWRDARIHYAVNCASYSCPNLAPSAFTAANTEALLEAGARAYINHPRGVALDGDDIVVSSIYDWFQEDFGGSEAGVLNHLAKYAEAPLAEKLRSASGHMRYAYDWALNAP